MKWFRWKTKKRKLANWQDFLQKLSEKMQERGFAAEEPWVDGYEDGTQYSTDILQDADILEILETMDKASSEEETLAEDPLWSPDLEEYDIQEEDYSCECPARRHKNAKKYQMPKETNSMYDFLYKVGKRLDAPLVSFFDKLMILIDKSEKTDPEVYNSVNMSRQLFSKMKKDGYHPGKKTVLALAIALELNLQQTQELLSTAGYALIPQNNKTDRIIQCCIELEDYDPMKIDVALVLSKVAPIFYEEEFILKEVKKILQREPHLIEVVTKLYMMDVIDEL